ncbi:hypothetical protein HYV86_01805 [Candidatus Woesearchaeota archaeon]|nr:hypothetical protein [Candidatus Woesearchaeota archaeon]
MTLDLYVCSFSLKAPFSVQPVVNRVREAIVYAQKEIGPGRIDIADQSQRVLEGTTQGEICHNSQATNGLYCLNVRIQPPETRMQFSFATRTDRVTIQEDTLAGILGEEFLRKGIMLVPDSGRYRKYDQLFPVKQYEVQYVQKNLASWLSSLGLMLMPYSEINETQTHITSDHTQVDLNRAYAVLPLIEGFDQEDKRERAVAFTRYVMHGPTPTIIDQNRQFLQLNALVLSKKSIKIFSEKGTQPMIIPLPDAQEELLLRVSRQNDQDVPESNRSIPRTFDA